jgi:heme/copper-type cytochrome/quinol oxidase subunit 3
MSARDAALPRTLPRATEGIRSTGYWGTIVFIATEATLFGSLISAYFYLRSGALQWPPDGLKKPELTLPLIMTVVLLSSSAPMVAAEMSIKRGSQAGLRIGLAIAFVLGTLFIAFQVIEYSRSEFTPHTDVYGSLFFTITGLHGAHVLLALVMNVGMQVRAWLGHFDKRRFQAIQNVGLYWHFVDAVWVVILAALYLSPYFL